MSRARLAALARPLLSAPAANARVADNWKSLSLRDYIVSRGWVDAARFEAADGPSRQAAVALLSSALTFPLTLARAWPRLLESHPTGGPVRLGVIGARAEASLPIHMWQEALHLTGATGLCLEFFGPAAALPSVRASGEGGGAHGASLRLELSHAGLYHESPIGRAMLRRAASGADGDALSDEPLDEPIDDEAPPAGRSPTGALPDAYVLFNPGLGEPGWERAWAPTVRALCASGLPLLLTALSPADCERDEGFLAAHAPELAGRAASAGGYEPNPFASCLPAEEAGGDAPPVGGEGVEGDETGDDLPHATGSNRMMACLAPARRRW